MKRRLWDREFRTGCWDCLDETPDDPAYPYVARYADGGRILDLGCGPGNAGRYLDPRAYRSYVGVDVSRIAIEQAGHKNRRAQNTYVLSDLLSYRPNDAYEVILLGDSLYYVRHGEVVVMLRRYAESLAETGVFIVKMHDASTQQSYLQLIRDHFDVIAEHSHPPVVLLVFR